jgi:hypothetical protein
MEAAEMGMEATAMAANGGASRQLRVTFLLLVAAPFGFAQHGPKVLPVPNDPLELVTGPVTATTPGVSRDSALQLLALARENFALKAGEGLYHLRVSFTADSGGATNYDGAWKMEEVFDPAQGLRWTARSASGYSTTRVRSRTGAFAEGTANAIPLRLHEAHGLLNDPLQSPEYADRGSIRTATETFRGAPVVCLLLSQNPKPALPEQGRAWEESEECIDPQSGLLEMHSEIPGRYVVYDYAQGPQLGAHILPGTVTVSEAGKVVSKISVDGIEELAVADGSQFEPTQTMKSGGTAITIKGAIHMSRVHSERQTDAMTLRAVCVFGVVSPSGHLVEAHSMQPSDPDSAAAVEDAKSINFSPSMTGTDVQQRFAFIVEKFIAHQ